MAYQPLIRQLGKLFDTMTAPSPTLDQPIRHGLFAGGYPLLSLPVHSLRSHAIWVADFEEHEDGEVIDNGEAALLAYPEWLDEGATRLIRIHAP